MWIASLCRTQIDSLTRPGHFALKRLLPPRGCCEQLKKVFLEWSRVSKLIAPLQFVRPTQRTKSTGSLLLWCLARRHENKQRVLFMWNQSRIPLLGGCCCCCCCNHFMRCLHWVDAKELSWHGKALSDSTYHHHHADNNTWFPHF